MLSTSQQPLNSGFLATIQGQSVTELPKDLYIPPDALRVFLATFEGPLDLLLYLIKQQSIDILDIPIAEVTKQYMEYIDLMQELHFELAAGYLTMAAILAEIKSRLLLPKTHLEEHEEDPRAELIRRLQEYEQFKKAAEILEHLPQEGRDVFNVKAQADITHTRPMPQIELQQIVDALKDVLMRAEQNVALSIRRETLSVRERMSQILMSLEENDTINFASLFKLAEGRVGVVVSFLAMLELLRLAVVEFHQTSPFGSIELWMHKN